MLIVSLSKFKRCCLCICSTPNATVFGDMIFIETSELK